jgi:fructose-1,6-bisphosphatase/inositol monophosphatase family enzyme
MPQEDAQKLLSQMERVEYMFLLANAVRQTGEHVLEMDPAGIYDTLVIKRHQFSTLDAEAGNFFRAVIAKEIGPFPGTIIEESEVSVSSASPQPPCLRLIVDVIEGSTNAKRGLSAAYRCRPILAGTLANLIEGEQLFSIAASAFYDFDSKKVFSSVRTERGSFIGFIDSQLINPLSLAETRGDSNIYAVVPGYSHENVKDRAAVEEKLIAAGIRITGGSRSSAQDLLDILCNQSDAYVDLRALFSGSTDSRDEVLHTWDVGGLLPILHSVGFCITNAQGENWQNFSIWDPLAIIVARTKIHQKILKAIADLAFVGGMSHDNVIPYPTPNIG